jgi:LysM repeat protein
MTSMTSRVGTGTRRTVQVGDQRRHLRVVPIEPHRRGGPERWVQALLAPGPGEAPLRLTRRGRFLLRGLVVLAALLVTAVTVLALARPALAADPSGSGPAVHVVQPGESLWEVARVVAPAADPRDTVLQIADLNDLSSSAVTPGQELVVPSP